MWELEKTGKITDIGTRKLGEYDKFPCRELIEAFARLKKEYNLSDLRNQIKNISKSQASRYNKWFVKNGLSFRINYYLFRKKFDRVSEWLEQYYVPNNVKRFEILPPNYF